MSMILSQSEHNDQQGEQAAGMVLAGDLTIPSGSHLRASGMVSLESGTLTIEDGAILEIDDQPPAASSSKTGTLFPSASSKVVIKVGDTPRSLLGSMREIASAGGLSSVDTERLLAEITGSPALLGASNGAAMGDTRTRAMLTGSPALVDVSKAAEAAIGWYTAGNKLLELERTLQASSVIGAVEAAREQFAAQLSIFPLKDDLGSLSEKLAEQMRLDGLGLLSEKLAEQMRADALAPLNHAFGQTSAAANALIYGAHAQLEQASAAANAMTKIVDFIDASREAVRSSLITWQPPVPASMMHIFDPEVPTVAQRQRRPPAQPAAPDWREALTVALKEGKASPKDVIDWLHGMNRPGQKPPKREDIEVVAALYKQHGHRYDSYEAFVVFLDRKGIAISVGTLKRWLKMAEAATGEQYRQGRKGRRKIM